MTHAEFMRRKEESSKAQARRIALLAKPTGRKSAAYEAKQRIIAEGEATAKASRARTGSKHEP